MKTLFDLILALSKDKDEARKLKGTEKGEKTVKYTVLSVINSLFGVAFAFLAKVFLDSLFGTESSISLVLATPILGLFGFAFALGTVLFFIHSLNLVSCQRIVNRKPCRFIALGLNLAGFVLSAVLIASPFL